ncbi:MAG: hypothetical protein ACM3PP_11650, partial [Candidatus Saccharibacteria bacterium]
MKFFKINHLIGLLVIAGIMFACTAGYVAAEKGKPAWLVKSVFANNQRIDDKYTIEYIKGGSNISIPLSWNG